jgi:serine/threonine protein kinase
MRLPLLANVSTTITYSMSREYPHRVLYLLFKYYSHDLDSIIKFNSHVLRKNHSDVPLKFICYQMLSVVSFIHRQGIAHGRISPTSLFVSDHLWLRCGCFNLKPSPHRRLNVPPTQASHLNAKSDSPSLAAATVRWANGSLSNFDYLMVLNGAAGREMKDSTFHPVMPWITNFSQVS